VRLVHEGPHVRGQRQGCDSAAAAAASPNLGHSAAKHGHEFERELETEKATGTFFFFPRRTRREENFHERRV